MNELGREVTAFQDLLLTRPNELVIRDPNMPGGNSAMEPPVPMPNTEVKRCSADGSVAFAM